MVDSDVVLCNFTEDLLSLSEGLDNLTGALSAFNNHWVLHEKVVKVASFVDLSNEFTMGDLTAVVDQESHDCFWYHITNILLDDVEVTIDQVLDNPCLHEHSCTLLLLIGPHEWIWLLKNDLWKVVLAISHAHSK